MRVMKGIGLGLTCTRKAGHPEQQARAMGGTQNTMQFGVYTQNQVMHGHN